MSRFSNKLALLLALVTALPAQAAGPILWGGNSTANNLQTSLSSGTFDYVRQSGPAAPATSVDRLFTMSIDGGNRLYRYDTSSVAPIIATGGELPKNYVKLPSQYYGTGGTLGWAQSSGTPGTSSSGGPADVTQGSVITYTSTASTNYIRYRFQVDSADLNKKLLVSFDYSAIVASGDYTVDIYESATVGGAYTRVALSTDASSVSNIPNGTGSYRTSFDSDSNAFYEIRFTATGASKAIKLANIYVGPSQVVQGATISSPTSYTPASSNGLGTLGTSNLEYRRVGDKVGISGKFVVGTVTAVPARIQLPTGLTAATAAGGATTYVVGKWSRSNTTANADKNGTVVVVAGSQNISFGMDSYIQNNNPTIENNGTACFSNADTVFFDGEIFIPIAEWQGGGTTNVVQNDCEYISNSSSTDADDTTSFVYGQAGSTGIIGTTALTAARKKRVRLQWPYSQGDVLEVQMMDPVGNVPTWVQPQQHRSGDFHYQTQWSGAATIEYGIALLAIASTAVDYDVYFSLYSTNQAAVYGGVGKTWLATPSSLKWRVRHCAGNQAVGFSNVAQNASGLVKSAGQLQGTNTNDAAIAGNVGEEAIQQRVLASATGLTTATAKNVTATQLTLTPGAWDVSGIICYNLTGATTTEYQAAVSLTSATLPASSTIGAPASGESRIEESVFNSVTTSGIDCITLPPAAVSIAVSTDYFLVARANFSVGTITAFGTIRARRMR